ncbi:Monocarboxylate transporter 7 [Holothuria leucospilota]|uniref:Monocarboxylate transporter 7 n=1 Tax=Holothuria leucospilota TaxID=206669 RepID=A0A9Q1C201_HOLLE|nr:Monocarboxylate transporter 7 [Holothuria leucospilota]
MRRLCFNLHFSNRKGLVVLAASTWLNILIYAPLTVFAILFVSLEDEFGASTTAIGEIGSAAWAVFNLSSPLPTFLIQKWGSRIVAATGVLMCGSGLLLSTISKQIWMLFVFYGVVQGLGLCFVQMASLQLLTCYFSGSALVRALSVAALGETIGMFAVSPIFTIGIEKLGWRLICQITALVIVTLCLPTCYVLGSKTHARSSYTSPPHDNTVTKDCKKEEAEDYSKPRGVLKIVKKKTLTEIWRIPGIWIFAIATVLYVLCMGLIMISLVDILVSNGHSMKESSLFVTIFAISQTIGKIVNIIIGNRLPVTNMKILVLMCITGGLSSLGMVYWEDRGTYILVFCIVNGLIRSNISSRNLPAAIEVFGESTSPILINVVCISIGIAFLCASLVGGLSYDLTGSYRAAHIAVFSSWFLAAVLLLPLAFLWPSSFFQKLYCCSEKYSKIQPRTADCEHSAVEVRQNGKTDVMAPSSVEYSNVNGFQGDLYRETVNDMLMSSAFKESRC